MTINYQVAEHLSETAASYVDARPIISTGAATAWDQARDARDQLAAEIRTVLDQNGLDALVLTSQDGNYPVWLRMEAWLPPGNGQSEQTRLRCALEIVIDARPYNRAVLVYAARATNGAKPIAVEHATRFSADDARQWAIFALGRGAKPTNYQPQRDRLRALLGVVVPPVRRDYNPVLATYRTPLLGWEVWAGLAAVAVCAAVVLVPGTLTPAAVATAIACIGLAVLVLGPDRLAHQQIAAAVQPIVSPRRLLHVDSWYTVISELGPEAGAMERAIRAGLADLREHGIASRTEVFGFQKPNGYEERERIVLSRGQGFVHAYVSRVGNSLFVGWQSQLNLARWTESLAVARRFAGRRETEFRSLVPGWYFPSEPDLFDLDSLGAQVHHAIERVIRTELGDRKLEYDLDFEITRGDRDQVLRQGVLLSQKRPEATSRERKQVLGSGWVREISATETALAPPGRSVAVDRGLLAAIPPVIALPLLVALFIAPLQVNPHWTNWLLQRSTVAQNFPFVFAPMFYMPAVLALAIGLRLWAHVRLLHAALLVPLAFALCLGASYASSLTLSLITQPSDWGTPGVLALVVFYGSLWSTTALMVAAAVVAPQLRSPRILATTIAVTAAMAAIAAVGGNFARSEPALGAAMRVARWVLFAGVVGYWLMGSARTIAFRSITPAAMAPRPVAARPARAGFGSAISEVGSGGWGVLGVVAAGVVAALLSVVGVGDGFSVFAAGLGRSAALAPAAVAIALVIRATGAVTFAMGGVIALAMFAALYAATTAPQFYWYALFAVPLLIGVVAASLDGQLRNSESRATPHMVSLATLGITVAIIAALRILFGSDLKTYTSPFFGVIDFGPFHLSATYVFALVAGLGACALAISSASPLLDRAVSSGDDATSARSSIVGIASGLAAFGGVALLPIFGVVYPDLGFDIALNPLGAVAVAGTTSLWGVVATCLLIGTAQQVAAFYAADARDLVVFGGIVLALHVYRAGLFGDKVPAQRESASVAASSWERSWLFNGLVAATAVGIAVSGSRYAMNQAAIVVCLAMLASSVSLVLGWLGMLSLGHVMFFGAGAYATALAMSGLGLSLEIALAAGAAAAVALAIPVGVIALRRGPLYSAVSTLVIAEMVRVAAIVAPITGGYNGLMIERPHSLSGATLRGAEAQLAVVVVIFAISVWLTAWCRRRAAVAALLEGNVRQGDDAFSAKLQVFLVSAAVAGMGGAAFAFVMKFVSPESFTWQQSVDAALMAVLGGVGTMTGPLIGAVVVSGIGEALRIYYGDWIFTVTAAGLIAAATIAQHGGIIGALRRRISLGQARH